MTPEYIKDVEHRFDDIFKATGSQIRGFKHYEYPNLRENQYKEAKSFLISEIQATLTKERERIVKELNKNRRSEKGWPQCAGLGCHDDGVNMNGIIFNEALLLAKSIVTNTHNHE